MHCYTDTLTADTFVIAMIYMERLPLDVLQSFGAISPADVHIAFAASFVVAQKLHTDDHSDNSHYANVAGLTLQGT